MRAVALLFFFSLAAQAGAPAPAPAPAPDVWFIEQITVASVDSGAFIAAGQAGAPAVSVLEFSSEQRCLDWLARNSALHFGVDQPMGTGSYFARLGVWFTECAKR